MINKINKKIFGQIGRSNPKRAATLRVQFRSERGVRRGALATRLLSQGLRPKSLGRDELSRLSESKAAQHQCRLKCDYTKPFAAL